MEVVDSRCGARHNLYTEDRRRRSRPSGTPGSRDGYAFGWRPLIEEGIAAYLAGDHAKAIHVILPQIEQALRELLSLMGVPTLKAGRNGTVQVKNLNDILREPAIKHALGDDVRLYLQTFLADERGQNIRNIVCHGLAAPALFNYRLADQALHALLTVSLVRAKPAEPPPAPPAPE